MESDERDVIEDLVIAVLAVNRWPLEKAFALKGALSKEGIFDFDSLATIETATIAEKLSAAGYSRGDYLTSLIADRLKEIARQMSPDKRRDMMLCLGRGDRGGLETLLLALKGVGPSVLHQFLSLREPGEP